MSVISDESSPLLVGWPVSSTYYSFRINVSMPLPTTLAACPACCCCSSIGHLPPPLYLFRHDMPRTLGRDWMSRSPVFDDFSTALAEWGRCLHEKKEK